MKNIIITFATICILAFISCQKETTLTPATGTSNGGTTNGTTTGSTTTGSTTSTTTSTLTLPEVYKKIYGASSVTIDDDYVVIKTTGVPDHKSPYFKGTSYEAKWYVADTRSTFKQAPNSVIAAFSYTFRIPLNPKEATTKKTLGTATLGVAVNGVPLFNQYAAGNTAIVVGSGEYVSFDLYGGHPAPTNDYHYHIEPNAITAAKGTDALIGFLLDGFPVYGPVENGKTVATSSLDAYHGHTTKTADYPNGIYHYHTTSDAPFINGNGFFGTAGTWTK